MIDSGPRLRYKFRADAAYYRTIIDRYYGQRVFLLRLPVQYGIVSLAIVGAFLGFKDAFTRTALGIGMVVVALLTASMVALTKISILYRFKRRADFGAEVIVTVAKDAITSSGRHAQGKWGWQAYPRSVRYHAPWGHSMVAGRGPSRRHPDGRHRTRTIEDSHEGGWASKAGCRGLR